MSDKTDKQDKPVIETITITVNDLTKQDLEIIHMVLTTAPISVTLKDMDRLKMIGELSDKIVKIVQNIK